MKTILVSGASGIIGYGILKSLRASGRDLKLIGTTIYNDSAAEGFCDVFELAVPTSDAKYSDWLIGLIKKHKIDFIIPGIEADMYNWHQNREQISEAGAKMLLNNPELISLCNDKWIFYKELVSKNSDIAIPSSLNNNYQQLLKEFGLPFLLKPRSGHGSKGIVRVTDEQLFLKHKAQVGDILMAQPIIGEDNEEYTISAFCDTDGVLRAYMGMKRRLSKDGFTEKAETVDVQNAKEVLTELCNIFKPIGPTNFQFRVKNNQLKLLEINPRISSSTSIRTKFGYNEALMAYDYFVEGKEINQPTLKKGRAVRYIEDLVIYE